VKVINSRRHRPKSAISVTYSTPSDASSSQSDCKRLLDNVTQSSARHSNDGYRRSSSRQSHVIGHTSTDAAILDAVCASDDVAVLELLKEVQYDVELSSPRNIKGLVDAKHRPVLCLSVENSASPVIMKALLQHGANPDDRMPGTRQTALHMTAKLGYQVRIISNARL
jgi:hypothetical protein